jgi:hypothetical protein
MNRRDGNGDRNGNSNDNSNVGKWKSKRGPSSEQVRRVFRDDNVRRDGNCKRNDNSNGDRNDNCDRKDNSNGCPAAPAATGGGREARRAARGSFG